MEKIDRYYLEITSINNLKGKDKYGNVIKWNPYSQA